MDVRDTWIRRLRSAWLAQKSHDAGMTTLSLLLFYLSFFLFKLSNNQRSAEHCKVLWWHSTRSVSPVYHSMNISTWCSLHNFTKRIFFFFFVIISLRLRISKKKKKAVPIAPDKRPEMSQNVTFPVSSPTEWVRFGQYRSVSWWWKLTLLVDTDTELLFNASSAM